MPAKDIYHDTVKNALIKDGWRITAENLQLPWGGTRAFIDIIADEVFVAEKEGRKIAVEVKSFIGKSNLSELEKASVNLSFIGLRCGEKTQNANCSWQSARKFITNFFFTRT